MITDGVFALPDASAVDSLLAQLRASTVCCSFIKLGSGFHAHCRYVVLSVQYIKEKISSSLLQAKNHLICVHCIVVHNLSNNYYWQQKTITLIKNIISELATKNCLWWNPFFLQRAEMIIL